MTIALWTAQVLVALVFLGAGVMKSTQPIEKLQGSMEFTKHFPTGIVRLIGILEILGALGLILPALTHILPWLTPLAAACLVLTMIGAILVHIYLKDTAPAHMSAPIILLLLALFIAYGRFLVVPLA